MGSYKLYVPNEKVWTGACEENRFSSDSADYIVLENAIIEPIRLVPRNGAAETTYLGGACKSDGSFVAGLVRSPSNLKMNLSVFDSYPVKEPDITYLEGEYIYGGAFIHRLFGHTITDSMVRLWYVIKHATETQKIIFIAGEGCVHPVFWIIMDMLGISRERIIIADRVYRCEKLYVPDQSYSMFGKYNSEITTAYHAVGSYALKQRTDNIKTGKKIYLTRTKLSKKDCFGEEYFENFYRKRGYDIVAPEQYSFAEQIQILAGAEEIVSTLGTLTHLILFIPNKVKLTMLLRINDFSAARPQLMFNSAADADYNVIDVSKSLLPTTHGLGVFVIGPTEHWRRYLDENGFTYTEDELKMDWSCLYDYFSEYTRIYSKYAYSYKKVKDMDMFDVINRMSNVFFGESIYREKMHTESKDSVMKRLRETERKLTALENQRLTFPKLLAAVKPYEKKLSVVSVRPDKLSVNGVEPDAKKYAARAHKKYGLSEATDKFILNFAYAAALSEKDCLVSFADGAELLSESEAAKFRNSAYDVLLFKKHTFVRTVADQYKDTHGEESYKAMTSALCTVCPEYYSSARVILSAHQMIAKNSFVMSSNAFAEYSSWLIPILAAVEKKLSAKDKALLPKIAERLQTVYFIHNKDKYNIAFFE